jgi:hypothetical protein
MLTFGLITPQEAKAAKQEHKIWYRAASLGSPMNCLMSALSTKARSGNVKAIN